MLLNSRIYSIHMDIYFWPRACCPMGVDEVERCAETLKPVQKHVSIAPVIQDINKVIRIGYIFPSMARCRVIFEGQICY